MRFTEELTPEQERAALLSGVGIAIVGFAVYRTTSYLRKKASKKRVAKMVAEKMPEVDAHIERLKVYLDAALKRQRKEMDDILARVDEAIRKEEGFE